MPIFWYCLKYPAINSQTYTIEMHEIKFLCQSISFVTKYKCYIYFTDTGSGRDIDE